MELWSLLACTTARNCVPANRLARRYVGDMFHMMQARALLGIAVRQKNLGAVMEPWSLLASPTANNVRPALLRRPAGAPLRA